MLGATLSEIRRWRWRTSYRVWAAGFGVCVALSCAHPASISVTDFNRTCSTDAECILAPDGALCGCQYGAINAGEAVAYDRLRKTRLADLEQSCDVCGDTALVAVCRSGQCESAVDLPTE